MVATKQESVQSEMEDTTQPIYGDEHDCKRAGCGWLQVGCC